MAAARAGTGSRRLVHRAGHGLARSVGFRRLQVSGHRRKLFAGLPLAGMEPNWTCTYGKRGLSVPGKHFVLYLPEGGDAAILSHAVPRCYRVFDPRNGVLVSEGRLADTEPAQV